MSLKMGDRDHGCGTADISHPDPPRALSNLAISLCLKQQLRIKVELPLPAKGSV